MSNKEIRPFVSIVIPVYNGSNTIGPLIESLLVQSYPRECYEIIIVDNGSSDNTVSIISAYENIILLHQKDVQSSYAARNLGIMHAKGDIIAFTDADCVVDSEWLKEGIALFQKKDISIVAGAIQFTFSSEYPTATEVWDSLVHLRNDVYSKNGCAVTANIFVRKMVFDKQGYFSEVSSGGDFAWTGMATRAGYKMAFAPSAIVSHPARSFDELMKKNIRVGTGAIVSWRGRGRSWIWISAAILSYPLPLNIYKLYIHIPKNKRYSCIMMLQLCLVSYIGRWYTLIGVLKSLR
jgi:glycosyltransferase involved in cell wall biosynthesis